MRYKLPKTKQKTAKRKIPKTYWDVWFPEPISLYTFVLVVFTGVLAFGGLYQLRFLRRAEAIAAQSANAAKDSADIANKTLIETQRPWLVISDISVSEIKRTDPTISVTFTYTIKNLGKTPATPGTATL